MKILAIPSVLDTPELELFIGLKQKGYEIELIANPLDIYREKLEKNQIQFTELLPKSRFDRNFIQLLRQKYSQNRYDIVHAFSSKAISNTIIALKNEKCKIIGYRGTIGHISRLNPLMYLTFFNSRLDKIICVSNAVNTYLEHKCKIPKSKLITIYKGHNPSDYKAHTRDELEKYKIPKNKFLVCLAANMRPVKGVNYLLEAFDELSDFAEFKDIHLLLVGKILDSKVSKRIVKLKKQDKVHAVGFQKDSISFIGASDLFVMPSIEREGLPKALIEAMSLSIPVIATSVGGMIELVENEKNGLIIPPKDSNALKEGIIKLYKNNELAKKLAENGKRTIVERFNTELMVEETVRVYKSLVSR